MLMRLLVVLFLGIGFLAAAPLRADERTWTIATGVFTAKAELLGVRGEIVYLKMGERVEEYPLSRLSAADQRYIASLRLAPVPVDRGAGVPAAGDAADLPAMDASAGGAATATADDILPTPVLNPPVLMPPTGGGATDRSLLKAGPTTAAPVGEEAIPLPPATAAAQGQVQQVPQGQVRRAANYGSATPPSALSNQLQYRAAGQPGNALNNNSNSAAARRQMQQQAQMQQQQASNQSTGRRGAAQQNQQDSGGLFNFRARRRGR